MILDAFKEKESREVEQENSNFTFIQYLLLKQNKYMKPKDKYDESDDGDDDVNDDNLKS